MPDEPVPEIVPLRFVQYVVLVQEETWPERTSLSLDMLQSPYVYGAVYDEQAKTYTFTIFNGGAVYTTTDERGPGGAVVAELVPDTARKTTRRP